MTDRRPKTGGRYRVGIASVSARCGILCLMAAPAAAEGSLVPLMGACEAAVAAEDVAPLEAVTPMRLQGETWIGEAGGLTVLFTPPVDAMYAVAGLTPATCSILAWADDGETLVPWSDVAPVVAGAP